MLSGDNMEKERGSYSQTALHIGRAGPLRLNSPPHTLVSYKAKKIHLYADTPGTQKLSV